ncbi:MAG: alpha-L-glutamate ligase-like protein [Gammaproteobacteria bacterium]|nr:alpha-L-glutamate ligase-like protein [Gammaproteobacteria bacterium]
MIGRYLALRRAGVLGLNGRNARYIAVHNPRRFYPLVDDKIRCKELLRQHGIPVPALLDAIRTQFEAGRLGKRLERLEQFAIKPACGSQGDGIIVIGSRRNGLWLSPSGSSYYSLDDLEFHVSGILNGLYSLGGQPDAALLEGLVLTDPRLRTLAPEGVPDIRIIVYRGVPVMAMVRLPTRRSGGKANLHSGGIGAGIAMATGRTLRAVMDDRVIDSHPDSGLPIRDFEVPEWNALLELAAACQSAVKLGYLGVDIVLDATHGPLVLELNARPGLSIQIANQTGLEHRLKAVDGLSIDLERLSPRDRAALAMELAEGGWRPARARLAKTVPLPVAPRPALASPPPEEQPLPQRHAS